MSFILLVDDEPDVCTILRTAFRLKGHEIQVAYDGEQALKVIAEQLPALIITDMQMPRMNGQEFFARLKTNPRTSRIPVMVITSLTLDSECDDEEWRRRMGVEDFISKPFEPMTVVERAERVLGLRS